MKYKLIDDGVLRSAGGSIPNDPDNRDWVAYQEWLAAGNTPIQLDEPIPTDFFNN
jgi:hypothetical protein